MAIHANSTPAPERTLLREVAAPGRLLPGPVTLAHARDLLAINGEIKALFNPSEMSVDEPSDFDGPIFEIMREWQDDELASLEIQRAEIEAKRAAELLAILDAGPLPTAFMTRSQRKAMQAGVDVLIAYLDAITPDCDLEPTMGFVMPEELDECEPDEDGEPSLGSIGSGVDAYYANQCRWASGGSLDLEEECEDEGACIQSQPHDPEPDEHGLGSLDRMMDQERWADGGCPWGSTDLELEDEHGGDVLDQPEAVYA